jgi:uncharacterized SAM-binding protein YcdF (DUF218 family)
LGAAALVIMICFLLMNLWFDSITERGGLPAASSDAVVIFAGGHGERLEAAVETAMSGSRILVIPNGRGGRWPEANRLCFRPGDLEVLCPNPSLGTTRGEARILAAIAEERGWQHLTMVTSDYHAARASALLAHCFDGDLTVIAAPSGEASISVRFRRWRHEFLGSFDANILNRDC